MAKVDELVLTIDGREYKYNINVGKTGIFKAVLDWGVAKKLGMEGNSLEYPKLLDLKNYVLKKYNAYIESTKVEDLFIFIRFEACGKYGRHINKSEFRANGFSGTVDSIGFEFDVYLRETSSTGTEVWYETRKGVPNLQHITKEERMNSSPDQYYKNSQRYGTPKGVMVPFSEQSLQTLEKARTGLIKISEILYGFISQEPTAIVQQLSKGALLQNNG